MPANLPAGQPAARRSWFESGPGQALIESEIPLIRRTLSERPALPWLWFSPGSVRIESPGRGLCLVANGGDWEGQVRCRLPLPLASESIATVVLQHVPAGEGLAELLGECARVLVDGGRVHLFTLNPLSPYRLRWQGAGLHASEPLTWRRRLRRVGLEPDPVSQGVGPIWRVEARPGAGSGPGLCAAYALRAEKRVMPLTPTPGGVRQLRFQQGLSTG